MKFKHIRLNFLLVALMSLFSFAELNAAPPTLKISMDSATLLMGKTTPLHIEITTDDSRPGTIMLPALRDTLVKDVEIAEISAPEVTDLGNNRQKIKQTVMLQSFEPGNYVLKPIKFIQGSDTVLSNSLALKVYECEADSLNAYALYETLPSHFWDFIPSWLSDNIWLILAILVAVGAGIYAYIRMRRRVKSGAPILRPAPKPVPPYELAMGKLKQLKEENLCEKGNFKEYYTRLTEILREYIDNRFHINAMEMTSAEILKALHDNEDTRLPEMYMRQLLQIADYVKFAKMRPYPEDNVKAFNDALRFVEETKPQPVAEPDASKENPSN